MSPNSMRLAANKTLETPSSTNPLNLDEKYDWGLSLVHGAVFQIDCYAPIAWEVWSAAAGLRTKQKELATSVTPGQELDPA